MNIVNILGRMSVQTPNSYYWGCSNDIEILDEDKRPLHLDENGIASCSACYMRIYKHNGTFTDVAIFELLKNLHLYESDETWCS